MKLLTLLLLSLTSYAQTFKIVGYYSLNSATTADLKAFPFDRLTHINLFFLNPDSTGTFTTDLSALRPFITAAHQHHIKVLPSIGGGSRHDYYHTLLKPGNRAKFVRDLSDIVLKNDSTDSMLILKEATSMKTTRCL